MQSSTMQKSYGATEEARSYDSRKKQEKEAKLVGGNQTYTSFPFFNSLITLAVSQAQALCNQEFLAKPAATQNLQEILNNAKSPTKENESHPLIPSLINALLAPQLYDDNRRIFVTLAETVSAELASSKMSDAVKRDILFILKEGLSVLEGVERDKVQGCIKQFEDSFNVEKMNERKIGFR